MATYRIYEAVCSLTLEDTPLFYKPAYGPAVNFTVDYSQRETAQPSNFTYSNLGPLWTLNWLSYITIDPLDDNTSPIVYKSSGGEGAPGGWVGESESYAADPETGAVLKKLGTFHYEYDYPDGSKQVYSLPSITSPQKLFMTQSVDPQGNALTYSYDSYFRLVAVTDATGLVTTLGYNLAADIYKITDVTDPFGRTAHMTYTADGNLASTQDMLGMVSQYNYTEETLTALQTPYGITSFNVGEDTNKRWVQINDPAGGQQRVETWVQTRRRRPPFQAPSRQGWTTPFSNIETPTFGIEKP